MIFSKKQHENIKKLHDSVKDAASYGTTFLEIDSIDEISLSSIVKTIKDTTDRFNDTLLEVTRGKVEKTDSRSGSAFIKFVIQVSDYRGTRQDWGDITVGVRYSSKKFREMMNVYLNEDKFIVAKFAQDISKKLKQYEGKTIYKNKTIPDSKVKDASPDVDHIADYLWTWTSDSAGSWNAATIIEDYITPETLTEENLKKGVTAAEKELDKVYSQLQTIVNKKLKEGYAKQKNKIKQMTDWYRKHEKYQG